MNWLTRLFNSPAVNSKLKSESGFGSLSDSLISPIVGDFGFSYSYPELGSISTQQQLIEWALGLEEGGQQALYLTQLVDEGLASFENGQLKVLWEDCYYINNSVEHQDSYYLLNIPPIRPSTWKLSEQGTVVDKNFKIIINGVEDKNQRLVQVSSTGAYCESGEKTWLMPPPEWLLIKKINSFLEIPESDKSRKINELNWGEIRPLAIKANASLSKYLKETVVITKDTIDIAFSKGVYVGVEVVTIEPGFEEAPDNWLEVFDRWGPGAIPEDVDFPTPGGRLQIILTEPVREVLSVMKREFPARRATGAKAQAFVRNPFAVLGEYAHTVLREKQIEEAKVSAGIVPTSFFIQPYENDQNLLDHIVLVISKTFDDFTSASVRERIKDAPELLDLINKIETAIDGDNQFFLWRNHGIDIEGDTFTQLEGAKKLLIRWNNQISSFINYEDIYCLDNYGEQIEKIGQAKPIYSPYIATTNKGSWLPENLVPFLKVNLPPNGAVRYIQVDIQWLKEFEDKISSAQLAGEDIVIDNRLPSPMTLGEAKQLAADLHLLLNSGGGSENPFPPTGIPPEGPDSDGPKAPSGPGGKGGGGGGPPNSPFPPPEGPKKPKVVKTPKESLILKDNVAELKYDETKKVENRAKSLSVPANFKPDLPVNFKQGISLKSHQIQGVAWLQLLHSKCPEETRGAILADDMGLGKTFQLLTVLASHYQKRPNDPPSLIVAPIALMKNWTNEANKFFDNFPEILLLHGRNLDIRRQPKGQIADSLLDKKIDSLLKPGWLGTAKVVLTTYEVLRDYEFSLARQDFTYMICDEAQKIKTPNTLVTLAAKKQKAKFRIACTGTPVENSLADLWCLFDFIQPGLLGSLQEFCDKFRKPIEAKEETASDMKTLLRAYIDPQMLRRMKEDIASELPEKINISNDSYFFEGKNRERLKIDISQYQRGLYADGLRQLAAAAEEKDAKRRGALSFECLHFMKAVCAEPYCLPKRTFEIDQNGIEQHKSNSPKMKWLLEVLKGVQEGSEKAIVFTEIREVQRALAKFIHNTFKFSPLVINGDTDERQDVIDEFQKRPGFGVIILSPLAAGFGLNIVEANHVIHYSRTWNPAKEGQATDRAYRIGQTRNVKVYCPTIIANDFVTFEENLDKLMSFKSDLAGDILDGVGSDISISSLMPTSGPAGNAETYVTIDDVDRLDGDSFEIFCRLLLSQNAVRAEVTKKGRGDGGVDLVVFKENGFGLLCQCKHTSSSEIGWDAVKEISAGSPAYQARYPTIRFQKMAITNRHFNQTARDQSVTLSIKLMERDDLIGILVEARIPRIQLDKEILENT
jgi:hypothetical protein